MSYETETVRVMWFEAIASGSSGTIIFPPNSALVTDAWGSNQNAVLSNISRDLPNFQIPLTKGGTQVNVNLEINGNYAMSYEAGAYPIALVYIYEVVRDKFDANYALFGRLFNTNIGLYDLYQTHAKTFKIGDEYTPPVNDYDAAPKKYVDDTVITTHNNLSGLQGGTVDEYYHFLAAEYTEISAWLDDVVLGNDGKTSIPQLILAPRAAALSDIKGSMYYCDLDNYIYVCINDS